MTTNNTAIILTEGAGWLMSEDDMRGYVTAQGYTVTGVYSSSNMEQATRALTNPTAPPGAMFLAGTARWTDWWNSISDTLARQHIATFFIPENTTTVPSSSTGSVGGYSG